MTHEPGHGAAGRLFGLDLLRALAVLQFFAFCLVAMAWQWPATARRRLRDGLRIP